MNYPTLDDLKQILKHLEDLESTLESALRLAVHHEKGANCMSLRDTIKDNKQMIEKIKGLIKL